MDEYPRALDVAQEPVAEPRPFGSAFYEPRHVGKDKASAVSKVHHAKVRIDRRKRIIGDLRVGIGDAGQKRRFAGIRETDQADVRNQLQFQSGIELHGRLAGFRILGSLVGRSREIHVPASAASAAEYDLACVGAGHVRNHFARFLFP